MESPTLKSSPLVRLGMAASMYLLAIWGHVALPGAVWFAGFLALVMCTLLIFWVHEAYADVQCELAHSSEMNSIREGLTAHDQLLDSQQGQSLEAAAARLDSLKADLMQQYAQFGRDQSSINSRSLGSWHKIRKPRNH